MQLPGPVRATVGLIASAADEAKHLPDRAVELPMLAVSTVLQMSLRAQQRYAQLAARGDEILNHRRTSDEPPSWATFDDPVAVASGAPEAAEPPVAARPAPRRRPARKATGTAEKAVRRPRHTEPSAFDTVDE